MFYYEVWVRSSRYHGKEPLTYSHPKKLNVGSIVRVELQHIEVLGLVSGLVEKPNFKTKEISEVLNLPSLPKHSLKLADWLIKYYPAPIGVITKQFLPNNLTGKVLDENLVPAAIQNSNVKLPPLTLEQKAALKAMLKTNTYLLHGRTGSGKTRLYIELAKKTIESGQSVIVLTPEISLTTQITGRFKEVFGNKVVLMHSKQTPKQRALAWLTCLRSKEPLVVIGPRSALFAPLTKVGLIVLDESHEGAYKQEQLPGYQTSRVAAYLASLNQSTLVLGSATPSVSDYYLAEQKNKPVIILKQLAQTNEHPSTEVIIVDKKDLALFPKSPNLSQPLLKAIAKALSQGEQCLLYLNRRGTARIVLCENCGWQATCPNCDVPLAYHGDTHRLRCHSCNYNSAVPDRCPRCNYVSVVFKTAGTKAIVQEVQKLFPSARIARFDTDNLKAESFEENYESALSGQLDILIGTQLLAKGLDLPKLSTVGIILADTSLYLPDFSAEERTFQLINQVLGRIGRGYSAGKAIIQTYHPDHPILNYAINSDYSNFYDGELASRQDYLFPPFCYLLKLTVKRANISSARSAAQQLKDNLENKYKGLKLEGPAPAFYERQSGKYKWQLVVKSKQRSALLKVIADLPANWSYDIDPIDLL